MTRWPVTVTPGWGLHSILNTGNGLPAAAAAARAMNGNLKLDSFYPFLPQLGGWAESAGCGSGTVITVAEAATEVREGFHDIRRRPLLSTMTHFLLKAPYSHLSTKRSIETCYVHFHQGEEIEGLLRILCKLSRNLFDTSCPQSTTTCALIRSVASHQK